MHTIEKISTVSIEMITTRFEQARQRAIAAHGRILKNIRGESPVAPSDLAPLPLPAWPDISEDISRAFVNANSTYLSSEQKLSYNFTKMSADRIVAAILAADSYADVFEALDRAYAADTKAAIAAHAEASADSVKTLIGLVAQS